MWTVVSSPLGRVVVPPHVPEGFTIFCTTRDYDGRIRPGELAGDKTLATCRQTHGANIVRAPQASEWRECDDCDALWTDARNTALAIKIADCLPIAIVDAGNHVIANIHSGWRGAAQQITARTLEALSPFDPATARAYLGPSIRQCCFEVGEEVATQFDERYLDRTRAKPHIDLVAMTREILLAHGLREEHISDSELCTRCDGSIFHSYRKDGKGGGRNLMVVGQ